MYNDITVKVKEHTMNKRSNKRSRKIMTETNFNLIKGLEDKLDFKDISKLSGYSLTTIWRVTQTNSFQNYIEFQREKRRQSDELRNIIESQPMASPVQEEQSNSLEQLRKIAESLEKLVEVLEKKKRLF